jgi:hypothetical protein
LVQPRFETRSAQAEIALTIQCPPRKLRGVSGTSQQSHQPRPLRKLRVEEMERLVESSPGDIDLRKAVLAELKHRSTASARQLAGRLGEKSKSGRRASSPRVEPQPSSAPIVATREPDQRCSLEILRAAFTLEAELLARWGMTAAMPEELREAVFRLWAERVGVGEDQFGRSASTLQRDRRRLSEEKAYLEQSS